MSRVFVSCSFHDRAVGERLGRTVRSLGHDLLDDRDDASGTAWWNEVVAPDRVERRVRGRGLPVVRRGADVPARRQARRRVRSPVVRLDLGDVEVSGCHPVVAEAARVRFDPDDLWAVARIARALDEAPEPPQAAAAYRDERPPPRGRPACPARRDRVSWSPAVLVASWRSETTVLTAAPIRWRRRPSRR